MKSLWMVFVVVSVALANSQLFPRLHHGGAEGLTNNSYIYYTTIVDGSRALKCVTDNHNCCTDSDDGNWKDERGRAVHQGADGATCFYVTRQRKEINLNRKSDCIPDTSGVWRCDIPDSSEVMQSIYIYISNATTSGKTAFHDTFFDFCWLYLFLTGVLRETSMNVTLHTEPSVSPPEFSIIFCTEGGPVKDVLWWGPIGKVQEDSDHETSQIIVDTSHNSVYENRLRVRGREKGNYFCSATNNRVDFFHEATEANANITIIGL